MPRAGAGPQLRIFRPAAPFEKRGVLIACEGPDAAGKTTLMKGLRARLRMRGREVVLTNWNDTTEIYNLMMRLNAAGDLDNDMRCIFGGVELAARYHYVVRPALHRGQTVLASKYTVSASAHALLRGHDADFVGRLYGFALEPDLTIYVDVPLDVSLERKLRCGGIGFWEAGLDLTLGLPLEEALRRYQRGELDAAAVAASFRDFQARLRVLQLEFLPSCGVLRLDGTLPPRGLAEQAMAALEQIAGGERQDDKKGMVR
jgi:hypothetical protein